MKNVLLYIVLTAFLAACGSQKKGEQTAESGLDRSIRPEAGPAPEIQLGEIDSFSLANGLKVFVVENSKMPTVAYNLYFDNDPVLEGEAAGYVNVTGDLLSYGTKTRSKEQLDKEVDFIGARLGTSSENVYGFSLKKHQEKLLELMADVVLNPSLKEEDLEKILTQVRSGLATQKDDPDAMARNVRAVLVYGKHHPYGEVVTEKTIENVTAEMCRKYYESYMRPNVSYLAVVGDISVEEVRPLIEKHFGDWKRGDVYEYNYPEPQAPENTQVALVNKSGAVQSVVNITYPIQLKPGAPDAIAAEVANNILGGGSSARLFNNLREKHAYTYGSYSNINIDPRVGSFNAFAKVKTEVTDSAIHEMLSEIRMMYEDSIPEEELNRIKNNMTGSFAIRTEDPQTIARFAINTERYDLPADYYANYLKNLGEVSAAEVQQAARKYMKPDNSYILIVGDREVVRDKVQRFSGNNEILYYDYAGNKVELMSAEVPEGMKAEDVISRYLNAIGGEASIKNVRDINYTYMGSIQGRELQLTLKQKAPNKFLSSMSMGGMEMQKQVFNGEKARESGMQGTREITGSELDRFRYGTRIVEEMHYSDEGYQLELQGIENIDGTDAYRIEVVNPAGKTSMEYYDVNTGLKIRSSENEETPGGTVTIATDYSDYKEVEGIKIPKEMTINAPPMPIKFILKQAEVNEGIPDSEFAIE
ncbi:MAG: insulinase family protein [Bacteroidia bacterium]